MRILSDTAADASTAPLLFTPASASAAAGQGGLVPPAGGGSNASFDADMVIILAAMLFLLVAALGLNSIIRCACALHGGRRRRTLAMAAVATPPAAATVVQAADAGMKKKAIRRIPVAVYEATAGVPGTECAICLGEFADGEKVRLLPRCHHGFHVQCIDAWLAAHSSCPICRSSLLEDGGGAGEPTVAEQRT